MPLPAAPLVTKSDEDAARVASALRGDPGAHRALEERQRPLAWRVARGFGDLDADDLADMVQESLVRARVKGRVLAGMARLRGQGS